MRARTAYSWHAAVQQHNQSSHLPVATKLHLIRPSWFVCVYICVCVLWAHSFLSIGYSLEFGAKSCEMSNTIPNSRKRVRSQSHELPIVAQSKHFINQHVLDQRDATKMKQIHGEFTAKWWKTFRRVFLAWTHAIQNKWVLQNTSKCSTFNHHTFMKYSYSLLQTKPFSFCSKTPIRATTTMQMCSWINWPGCVRFAWSAVASFRHWLANRWISDSLNCEHFVVEICEYNRFFCVLSAGAEQAAIAYVQLLHEGIGHRGRRLCQLQLGIVRVLRCLLFALQRATVHGMCGAIVSSHSLILNI